MDILLGIFGVLSGILMILIPVRLGVMDLFWLDNDKMVGTTLLSLMYCIVMLSISLIILFSGNYFPIFNTINGIVYMIFMPYCINRIIHYLKYDKNDNWKRIIYKLFNFDDLTPFTYQIILLTIYIINNIAFRFLYKYIMSGGFSEWMKILTTPHSLMS